MKKLFLILFLAGISLGSFAQHGSTTRVYYYHPRVFVGLGAYSPFYPYYGIGYGIGYVPYFGYPPYGYPNRASKMELQVEDIHNDYRDKIKSAKSDKSISKQERKEIVKKLKTERNQAIDDLKKNYYKHK
ncbi:MAG: hypothetical protein ACHQEM_08560 [Chitinophagales bacterium]